MVYYITLDGEEYDFDHSWQVFEFCNFNRLNVVKVVYVSENGKAKQYTLYDNGKDRVFPVYDAQGQQLLDKSGRPVKNMVCRWKLEPVVVR